MDPNLLPLGKHPARHDPRTLVAARYMGALPPAPASVDWTGKLPAQTLGMMLNDKLGDCTCAGMGHAVQLATAAADAPSGLVGAIERAVGDDAGVVTIADADILLAYEQACGYNPADPATDRGGVELDVLTYWRTNGIGNSGHKINAFAKVNVLNQAEVMQALDLFGFLYTGVALPASAQAQVGGVWDVDNTPNGAAGSWGGHCVVIGAADAAGLTCITWGAYQKMTWAFWQRYFYEAYCCLTPDWIEADGQSPSGFDLATLQGDLAQIS
jgi:hypothetical protein